MLITSKSGARIFAQASPAMKKTHQLTTLAFATDKKGDSTEIFFSSILANVGSLASFRLQIAPAILEAQRMGITQRILSLHSDKPEDIFLIKNATICLVAKMASNNIDFLKSMIVANLAALTYAKNRGSKIVIIYSDHWLHSQNMVGDFYRDLLLMADYVVYPTQTLMRFTASNISKHAEPIVITDPWQIPRWHNPRLLSIGHDQAINLIWFGSNLNIDYLLSILPSILTIKLKTNIFELTILGAPRSLKKCQKFLQNNSNILARWRFRFVAWNASDQPKQLEEELSKAHICIIPSDPEDPAKAGVSPNRLVDALKSGCITIASPMESYKDLSEISLQGKDFKKLLVIALTNYSKIASTLTEKRNSIMQKYSPEVNRCSWNNFWRKVLQESNDADKK